jgi:DNA modification methylase
MPDLALDAQRGSHSLQRLVGRHSWALLINGSSETMELPPADALISDPPYGINYKPEGGGKVPKNFSNADCVIGDDKPFDPAMWLNYSIVVLWGGSNFAARLPATRGWLVWDKKCGVNETNQFSDCEIAWTNLNAPIRLYRHRWTGYMKDSEKQEARLHPTQKPAALMAWCMEKAKVPEGATVLDPYMGSGTTGIACLRTKRNFIGVEKDKRHFDNACDRMRREIEETLL